MTRAVLIFNPHATTTSPRVRDVIAHALSDVVKLEVAETTHRDHATELAHAAAADGADVVFCLGGDGTLNETLQGLAGTETALAVLPGGGTNVFARTLGLPRDPVEATSIFIERLRTGEPARRIALGVVNGRRYAFCAGIGFDAEVVRAVHDNFARKQRWGEAYFIASALKTFFFGTSRKDPALTITLDDGHVITGAHLAVMGKSSPYTFLGSRPFRLTPGASMDTGIELIAVKSMKTRHALGIVFRAFGSARHTRLRHVVAHQNLRGLTVDASHPVALQADGEYLGTSTSFRFTVEPNALSVLS